MNAAIERPEPIAAQLVRVWLRLYTFGASDAGRERRRQQVESDLWEEQAASQAAGLPNLRASTNILGRMARGMPADLLWRTNYGGPLMEIRIPGTRAIGIIFLALIICVPIATTISGYDTSRESWPSEATRLGHMGDRATIGNVAFQVMAGLALICSGVGLGVLLFRRAPVVATAGGVLMAAAGVLTLMNSAVYAAMAELARDYVDGNSTDASLEAARSLGLVLSASTNAVGVALVAATGSFAIAISRARLVPRWVALLPLGAIALTVAGTIAAVITGWSLGWAIFFGIFIVSVFWFLFVGGMLLFGRDRSLLQPPVSPA